MYSPRARDEEVAREPGRERKTETEGENERARGRERKTKREEWREREREKEKRRGCWETRGCSSAREREEEARDEGRRKAS